jgi:hypothetical protein
MTHIFQGMTISSIAAACEKAVATAETARNLLSDGTPCMMCMHRRVRAHEPVRCNKWSGVEIPDDVQRSGCEAWVYDDIPF